MEDWVIDMVYAMGPWENVTLDLWDMRRIIPTIGDTATLAAHPFKVDNYWYYFELSWPLGKFRRRPVGDTIEES
jgi:hypothetical protein